jgi:hypothetical protein
MERVLKNSRWFKQKTFLKSDQLENEHNIMIYNMFNDSKIKNRGFTRLGITQ